MSKAQEITPEITKIHFGAEIFRVEFQLDQLPFSASDDNVSEDFSNAMAAMVSHAIAIKELPKDSAKGYRCNAVSLTCKVTEQGENRTALISVTKITSGGKADNMSTPTRLYAAVKSDADLLPEKTILAIKEVRRQAHLFITGNRRLKKLYAQDELEAAA